MSRPRSRLAAVLFVGLMLFVLGWPGFTARAATAPTVADFNEGTVPACTAHCTVIDRNYSFEFAGRTTAPSGDTLIWHIDTCSPPGQTAITVNNTGVPATGGGDVSFADTPAGNYSCTYHVTDQTTGLDSAPATFTYTVTPPARPTVADFNEGTVPACTGHCTVIDRNYSFEFAGRTTAPSGDTLIWHIDTCSPPGQTAITVNNTGVPATGGADVSFADTPAGNYSCTYHVTDQTTSLDSAPATFTYTVTPPARPTVADFNDGTVPACTAHCTVIDRNYSFEFAGRTTAPSGDTLIWHIDTCSPPGQTAITVNNTGDPATGGGDVSFADTPAGNYSCTYHVTDQTTGLDSAPATFTYTVTPPARPPVADFNEGTVPACTGHCTVIDRNYSFEFAGRTTAPSGDTLIWHIDTCSPPG